MSKRLNSLLIFGVLLTFIVSCVPAEDSSSEVTTAVNYSFQDSIVREINNWAIQQGKNRIYPYLKHTDATYRYAGALAFSAMVGPEDIDSIAVLLDDPSPQVRVVAAYVLGQSGIQSAQSLLVNGFRQYDSLANNDLLNATILEAIGKCGDEQYLQAMTSVSTYQSIDTTLLLGQLRGIYGYMQRDITTPEGISLNLDRAANPAYPNPVRHLASNFLYRVKNPNFSGQIVALSQALNQSNDPLIDMGLVVAANKSKSDSLLPTILNKLSSHPDYRVRCNIIRSLANFPINQVWNAVVGALNDSDIHVANLAAQFIYDHGNSISPAIIRNISRGNFPTSVKAHLLAASNKYYGYNYSITRANISGELRAIYEREANPMRKGRYAIYLANDIYQVNYIIQQLQNVREPGLETQLIQALVNILDNPKLEIVYPAQSVSNVRSEVINLLKNKMANGHVAAASLMLGLLESQETLGSFISKEEITSYLSAYDQPDKIDTYNEIAQYLEVPEKPNSSRNYAPIDWANLNIREATINTTKGEIDIEFYPLAAPETVSRFINLIKSGFYNNNYFHRVVPNFVIQAGCPIGDGYGSTDIYLRTEVPPLHYDKPGYIGMASSGKDTESTQFFITHSPTPHLDGKYTLFAQVTKGMDVVHRIEFGDQIQSINY